jgi:hypothetical protein
VLRQKIFSVLLHKTKTKNQNKTTFFFVLSQISSNQKQTTKQNQQKKKNPKTASSRIKLSSFNIPQVSYISLESLSMILFTLSSFS